MNAVPIRTVAVIDDDLATSKGIARVGRQADFSVVTLPDCWSFSRWLDAQVEAEQPVSRSFCLVVDVRSLISDPDWHSNKHIQALPKICVGTPAAMSMLGPQMNAFQGEFVRKPFTLASIRMQIESAFARYVNMVSAETESRNLIELFGQLTSREREVAALVGSGSANLEIAAILGITLKTVKAHRAKVMGKTRSNTIADFVRKYERYLHATRAGKTASGIREEGI